MKSVSIILRSLTSIPAWWYPTPNTTRSVEGREGGREGERERGREREREGEREGGRERERERERGRVAHSH